MPINTPAGITPPAPGLDREEPDFWSEDDIPSDDRGRASGSRDRGGSREDRSPHQAERE